MTKSRGILVSSPGTGKAYVHGDAKKGQWAPEYGTWTCMWRRCRDTKDEHYPRYGGRGITVCDEWASYAAFLADMGRKPSKLHTLDRIDNDKGYNKANCRWATATEQNRNSSQTNLNEEKVKEIRRLYSTGQYSQGKLATKFSVSQPTIHRVVTGKVWS
jgi:hypothetical protein